MTSVANVGTDKAVQSLSVMLKVPVHAAKSGTAKLLSLDEVSNRLSEKNHGGGLALGLEVTGDLEGKVLITIFQEDIPGICRLIPRVPQDVGLEHPLVRSALLEMCNILASSYMSAIAEYTGLDYLASPPVMAMDMLDAIVISVLVDNNPSTEQVMYFDAELMIQVEPFRGSMLYFPSEGAIARMTNLMTGGSSNEKSTDCR